MSAFYINTEVPTARSWIELLSTLPEHLKDRRINADHISFSAGSAASAAVGQIGGIKMDAELADEISLAAERIKDLARIDAKGNEDEIVACAREILALLP